MTLKHLSIHNIVLVENASIEFDEGFNIITGETGAGKSAVLQALKLLCGERYDSSILRHGCEKGWTEAAFEPAPPSDELCSLLSECGISWNPEEPLILRRELSSSGKSRCFINNQLAQKNLLQQTAGFLLYIVGQHASRELLQPDRHRHILDTFAGLQSEVKTFSTLWSSEKALKKELELLQSSEKERLRTIEALQREIEELSEANLREGEEEELFEEYTLLMNAESIIQQSTEFAALLQGDAKSVLSLVAKAKKSLEKLATLVPSLSDAEKLLENAEIELREAAYTVSHQLSHVENNPKRAAVLDERMSEIARLKRRYGNDIPTMLAYLDEARTKLESLENSDETIVDLQNRIAEILKEQDDLAAKISCKRVDASERLSKVLTQELKQLNMPHVEVDLKVEKCPRCPTGDDVVEFYLRPNLGEKTVPLRQCASGGELSRFLLALQYILSGQDNNPALVFDEIDANIGGETASVIGQKLRGIGEQRQVLCVSHFPQVAAQAHRHLCISKRESNGRTRTVVEALDNEELDRELLRMAGGQGFITKQ